MSKSSHEKISELLISIGNPVRVQILLAIGNGEACVCHLEAKLGLRQAYISQQLMRLRKQGLITSRREGKYIFYRLAKPEVLEIFRAAGEILGVAENTLVIEGKSKCNCPMCTQKKSLNSTDQAVREGV